MGVRGFLTYAAEKGYFEPYELQSTVLIIDAKVMDDLSVFFDYNGRLGGEYKTIYAGAYIMFSHMKKCGITAIVVEDGYYNIEKTETDRRRMERSVACAIGYRPDWFQRVVHQNQESFVPILHSLAVRDALDELKICSCRAEFCADREIVKLARKLKCPVVGSNPEFCISDGVDFILWESMDFNPSLPFIKCLRFNREKFLQDHGISSLVLQFFLVLFSSDCSIAAVFYKLFPDRGNMYSSLRYEHVLSWLKNKTDKEIRNELLLIKPKEWTEETFLKGLNSRINKYQDCAVTVLPVLEENETVPEYLENVQFNVKETTLNKRYNVPLDIANKVNSRQLSVTILSVFVSVIKIYDDDHCEINTHEDDHKKSIYYPTTQLLSGIFGVISKYTEKSSITMKLIGKKNEMNVSIHPSTIKNTEPFQMLYEIMEINPDIHKEIQDFDGRWTIFILTMIYWKNKCKDIVHTTHVHSLFLSVFALHVSTFTGNKFTKDSLFPLSHFNELKPEDCETFLKKKVSSWKVRPEDKIDLKNMQHIHVFRTFQACLLRVTEIFPLLNLPHKIRAPAFISGVLYHSIYNELEGKWNCMRHVNNIHFFGSDKLRHLYYSIVSNKIIADLLE